ncbi:LysR family transcriptional regulator [Shouchella clausii]|uniref:LysR family transcriptional regulator n=1 Tax=Shouchella clausii TaxID=79880 RepID=UPI000BA79198|nr:LysR family transcriptional regulator [Shouchella clausii]PAD46281.1 hypothetical protein CHI09_13330 [Shouchella clausii]
MNIHWIESFLAAAKYENFRKAAAYLYVSQPTVTVHIHQLEKALGVPLFKRTGRQVVLTAYGKSYLPYARNIYDAYHEGVSFISKKRQGYESTLKIAVSPLVASSYLPYWVKAFVKKQAATEVVVDVVESAAIGQMVESGRADVGLSRMPVEQTGSECARLQTEKLLFVVPHDGRDAENGPPIHYEEALTEMVLLSGNHPVYWEDVLLACRRIVPGLKEMHVSQVHVTKRFIEEGLGCSILPESAVRRELAEGRMLEAETAGLPLPTVSTYMVTKSPSAEAEAFVKLVKSLA